jgi:hypothetical protein
MVSGKSFQDTALKRKTFVQPIGQGLTGLSTLAVSSVLAATGILLGAAAALRSPVRIIALASA